MPWKEVKLMDQRTIFIKEYYEKKYSMSQLCQQYNISRKTGYKWLERFEAEGVSGLGNKSRAPNKQARALPEEVTDLIISIKSKRPTWGPKKIHGYIQENGFLEELPCRTTVENILKRNGLVRPRKFRQRLAKRSEPLYNCNASNDVWTTDFKGWCLTTDKKKFGPFTLMDAYSRFIISCTQLTIDNTDHVWAILEQSFYEFGLPIRIRSDNGPPFATTAPGRLSQLSIKLIKAGVIPEWIEPGHPEQNGRQERMHLTLQTECDIKNLTFSQACKRLAEFEEEYNFVRPHEALGQKCPQSVYRPLNKIWDGKLRSPEYIEACQVGKVKSCGKMSWKGGEVYISRIFEGEPLGIYEKENGFTVYYGPIELGIINGNRLEFEKRQARRKCKLGASPQTPRKNPQVAEASLES